MPTSMQLVDAPLKDGRIVVSINGNDLHVRITDSRGTYKETFPWSQPQYGRYIRTGIVNLLAKGYEEDSIFQWGPYLFICLNELDVFSRSGLLTMKATPKGWVHLWDNSVGMHSEYLSGENYFFFIDTVRGYVLKADHPDIFAAHPNVDIRDVEIFTLKDTAYSYLRSFKIPAYFDTDTINIRTVRRKYRR